jgi:protein TonB
VWVAEKVQCPLDPTKPWEFSDEQPHLHQVGGEVSEPKAIFNPKPNLTETEGFDPRTIPVVEAVINKDGAVERIGALRGSGPPLDAAVDAIKKWRFEPATLNGEPVCVVYIMTVFIHY